MQQAEARQRAREIYRETGTLAIADQVRRSETGRLIRGGWPHPGQTWVVFEYGSNKILAGAESIDGNQNGDE